MATYPQPLKFVLPIGRHSAMGAGYQRNSELNRLLGQALLEVAVCRERPLLVDLVHEHLVNLHQNQLSDNETALFINIEIYGSEERVAALDDLRRQINELKISGDHAMVEHATAFLVAFWLGKVRKTDRKQYLEGGALIFRTMHDMLGFSADSGRRVEARGLSVPEAEKKHTGNEMGNTQPPEKPFIKTAGILEMTTEERAIHRAKIDEFREKSRRGEIVPRAPKDTLDLIDSKIKTLDL